MGNPRRQAGSRRNPLEAARREVLEETGISCEITGLVAIFSNPRNVVEFTSNGEVRQEFSILLAGRRSHDQRRVT